MLTLWGNMFSFWSNEKDYAKEYWKCSIQFTKFLGISRIRSNSHADSSVELPLNSPRHRKPRYIVSLDQQIFDICKFDLRCLKFFILVFRSIWLTLCTDKWLQQLMDGSLFFVGMRRRFEKVIIPVWYEASQFMKE